ncbi:MaoC like domain protein [Liquorilactobacillus sucicola DSM 21376 = JCM 15457]|uniref:Dehydrogenase n=1 Tax=Liquorilactobacillus sucicola DSM 21376 = JCM 15457 TaxID=1423806 RepID=A0A023CTX1_9LACO|nr:MaoC/PaaZ C-terminal domain-containing protein [Liquorilactobacillus sucicola]KRN05164.1 dehydrogenase [Liquorilactobacillus sucicola DSM 21376 = JCM 15457]GAJ25217.1 MaoC like domain protein [Liquorilactobacillus sucicola DSM 21376 = JCM 15457]
MSEDTHRKGKTIDEIAEGDSLTVNESLSDRDILLYLGMTNDNNPLYIQNEYAREIGYKGPVVPPVLLTGIITSSISKLLPGPGSEVVNLSVNFMLPVYHDENVTFIFEVIKVDTMKEVITLSVTGTKNEDDRVVDAIVMVKPPRKRLDSFSGINIEEVNA